MVRFNVQQGVNLIIGNIVELQAEWLRKDRRFAICSVVLTAMYVGAPKGLRISVAVTGG